VVRGDSGHRFDVPCVPTLDAGAVSSPVAGTSQPARSVRHQLNTEALGHILYTRYVYFFQAAGMVLLVAMIGAIVLTLHHKPKVRRQNIAAQNARTKETAMEVRKVPSGQGLVP